MSGREKLSFDAGTSRMMMLKRHGHPAQYKS